MNYLSVVNFHMKYIRKFDIFEFQGILTNKDLLPVSALNFGRIPPGSNGKYTLGKLECSGRVAPSIVPTDVAGCYDMFLLGQELSGFYLVSGGGTKIKVVYCDYSRSPLQTGEFLCMYVS